MTTETQDITKGNTQWVNRPDDTRAGHHLSRFGVFGVQAYRQAMYTGNPAARRSEIESLERKAEQLPSDPESQMAREYATRALTLATQHADFTDAAYARTSCEREMEVIEAMHTLDEEHFPWTPPVREPQPSCCRHGVPYSQDCPECED